MVITVQQITVIMQQILQIMEKPGRMEKSGRTVGLKENLGEYISVVSAAADGSIFVGQICLLTGTMKMHRQQPTVGKRILRMTT